METEALQVATPDVTSFLIYGFAVLAIVLTMLGLSFVLGQEKAAHSKNLPFESGIVSVGSAKFRTTIHFYLPAILFIIFDLEVVFLFAWAVAVREAGWADLLKFRYSYLFYSLHYSISIELVRLTGVHAYKNGSSVRWSVRVV